MSGVIALGGTLLIIWIIIMVAFAYFIFIGVEGIIVNGITHAPTSFWLVLIITLVMLIFGSINPIIGGINILVGIYGLILYFG